MTETLDAFMNRVTLIEGFDVDFFYINDYDQRIIVDKDRNYLYCPVPKSANTAIKHALIGGGSGASVHQHIFHVLADIDDDEKDTFICDSVKFLVVRDPYVRLLSAYRNKFGMGPGCQGNEQSDYWKSLGRFMVRYSRPESVIEGGVLEPTFSDFVKFVYDLPIKAMNEHWHPQAALAMVDDIKYDYVIKLEEMEKCWPLLAELLGLPALPTAEAIDFAPTNADDFISEYYTDELRALVAKKFMADFTNFGYAI